MTQPRIFAFECRVEGEEIRAIVNAPTAGKARYRYWLRASDACPDLKLIDITVRKVGRPHTDERLLRVCDLRGMRLAAGDRVRLANGEAGTIIGAGYGADFEVWLDGGRSGFVHPGDITPIPLEVRAWR